MIFLVLRLVGKLKTFMLEVMTMHWSDDLCMRGPQEEFLFGIEKKVITKVKIEHLVEHLVEPFFEGRNE